MSLRFRDVRLISQLKGLGFNNKEIADMIGISNRTVQKHLNNIKEEAREALKENENIYDLYWITMLKYGWIYVTEVRIDNEREYLKKSDKYEI